ncbi:MAG: guanine deaminase, partial [Pseudomonadales bacterium]
MSAIRGRIAHITSTAPLTWEYYADGILVIEDGHISDLGPAERLFGDGLEPAACEQVHGLLLPGFVDTHVHSPQIDVIGSYGEQLLEWLERYTFPAEAAYVDEAYAAAAA